LVVPFKIPTGGGIHLKIQAGFQSNSGTLSPAGTSQLEYIDRKADCPSGRLMGVLPADILPERSFSCTNRHFFLYMNCLSTK
jgi:hypothetical protein